MRNAKNLTNRLAACLFAFLSITTPDAQAATASRTSSFAYDPASGLLVKEIIEPGDPQLCLVTEYTYDAFGNKTSVTTRNCNGGAGEAAAPAGDAVIVPRTTSSTYDAKGQFAVTTTNALNHTETRTFDARFGAVASLTGPNGLTTTWSYDSFGRKTLETRADGATTTWAYVLHNASWPYMGHTYLAYYTATSVSGNAYPTYTYYDALNRKFMSAYRNFDNSDWIVEGNTFFDSYGRVSSVYQPYYWASFASAKYATYIYDLLGRVITETAPDNGVATRSYAGLTTTATNALNQTKTTLKNSQGQTVTITDAQNKTVGYTYDPFGNLTQTTDALGNVTTLTYDARGRKTGMVDPDMGSWSYAYNALGELIRQVDAKAQTVTMAYDKLGRMTGRTEPDLVSTWVYDTAVKGIGKLATATSDNGYSRTHSYDALGRPSGTSTVIDNPAAPYVTGTTYDAYGRTDTQTYPTGFAVKNIYNANGYLIQIVDAATPTTVYWTANSMDAQGHLTGQTYGNGITTQQVFDPATGRITNQYAGAGNAVQNMGYTYDTLGNLTTRTDTNQNLVETYLYDTLNRLTTATATSGAVNTTTSFAYDAIGNITCKSDLSACSGAAANYVYNASGANSVRPHAVTSITGTVNGTVNPTYTYDANGNMTAGAGRTTVWTSFNIPGQITSQTPNGAKTAAFWYNPEHERIKELQADQSIVITLSPRYDTGLHFEKKYIAAAGVLTGAVEYEHYLYAGGMMFGKRITVTTTDGITVASTSLEYYSKDNLGSIVAITDGTGAVMQRLSYDPWGKRRYPNGAADPNGLLNNPDMYHGYTGHEMLDDVGLIHMNGRLYDPVTARFVSADFMIEDPYSLQSYNRYTYVWNNPLANTDASGQCFICAVAIVSAIVGRATGVIDTQTARGIIGVAAGAWLGGTGGLLNGSFAGAVATGGIAGGIASGWQGVGPGMLTAGLFQGAGSFADDMLEAGGGDLWASGGFGRVMAHAVAGCVGASAGGGNCGNGALSAGFAEFAGPKLGNWGNANTFKYAIVGGTASVLGGGKFQNGAMTGAFGYLFNCEGGHNCSDSREPVSAGKGILNAKKATVEQCVSGCIQSNYGQLYEVADQLSPLSTIGVATEFVTKTATQKLDRQLSVNAVRNSYGGKLGFETSQRQFRTLSQFRTFNAVTGVMGASAAGFQVGAQLYCRISCE